MELYNATALSLFCACVCERETSLGLSIDNTQSHFLIFVFSNCYEYPYKDMTIFSPKWHTDISLKTDSCHDANYLVAGGPLAFRFDNLHDDVIKWKHFPRYWPFVQGIHRSPVNSPHKGQWRGALMFSLICVWINGSVNNREAGDLRRHQAHCDVSVMLMLPVTPEVGIIMIPQFWWCLCVLDHWGFRKLTH